MTHPNEFGDSMVAQFVSDVSPFSDFELLSDLYAAGSRSAVGEFQLPEQRIVTGIVFQTAQERIPGDTI
jgi:hypothetical protein